MKRKVLGRRQCDPRGEQALDRRIARLVEEEHRAFHHLAFPKTGYERLRFALGDSDRGEHDRERLCRGPGRAFSTMSGSELDSRQPWSGEHGQLLAAERGYSSRRSLTPPVSDEIRGVLPSNGIDRRSPYWKAGLSNRRRQTIEWLAGPAERAPEHVFANHSRGGFAGQGDRGRPPV